MGKPMQLHKCIGTIEFAITLLWSVCRENRYVLFLTENYAALEVLKNNYLSINQAEGNTVPPFVLFGSSFPKDKEYTQVYCGSL